MKTKTRGALILVTVLAMAVAYLGGALVFAQTSSAPAGPRAPALTNAQWAALEAANALLLDGDDEATTYLPLVSRQ